MPLDEPAPPVESLLELVRGELSPRRRWMYRVVLIVTSIWVAAIAGMWVTEPTPIPARLHIAFGTFTGIGLGWIVVLIWLLTRHRCPTAIDRLATAWIATFACGISLFVSVAIALVRNEAAAAVGMAIVGLVLLSGSVCLLRSAYLARLRLAAQLREMENAP